MCKLLVMICIHTSDFSDAGQEGWTEYISWPRTTCLLSHPQPSPPTGMTHQMRGNGLASQTFRKFRNENPSMPISWGEVY